LKGANGDQIPASNDRHGDKKRMKACDLNCITVGKRKLVLLHDPSTANRQRIGNSVFSHSGRSRRSHRRRRVPMGGVFERRVLSEVQALFEKSHKLTGQV